ncbi:phenylacetate--CoA ligase family protein [Kutzneria sp. CA-103260]|uniref:phenylacetate--CoA ligase family protein n=1 Tax=Kutzneria sp. CA-103260 TaxID=2802641 RepID=UPI001BA9D24B|nr:phenylacetate--CoA ligase family protein [Kutzneria sp. CA-103260]QUQ65618.1 phenylacetate--CoA ligase family protein [Kutzneria sp. CA-103260]
MAHQSLSELVAFARANSPFYRELYAGLPADVDDLTELPLIDHGAFWAANTVHGNTLRTGPHTDGIVFKTGGTTSAPRISVYTRPEWREMATTFASGLPAAGVRSGDRVANLFYAGELYSSFVFTLNLFQVAPVDTVQLPIAGGAAPEFVVLALTEFRATVLAAPPTSLCQLAQHVRDTVGWLPDVRVVLFSGEAFYGDQRALLAAAFPNSSVRSIGYASVDGGILAAPVTNEPDSRVHQAFAPSRLLEILDLQTGAPITTPGRAGRVVVTDLVRRLQPVIRYPVGDLAEWVDPAAGTFRLLGRSDEGARVGPVTLYLDDLRSIVEQAVGPVSGMQVVLRRRDSKDQLVLRLAGTGSRDSIASRLSEVRPMFADHVRRGLIQPLAVEWVKTTDLHTNPRTGKLVRLLDERGA